MKFSELKNGDQFVLVSSNGKTIFEKLKQREATCCSPKYNAACALTNKKNKIKKPKFINPSTEVKKRVDKKEENVTIGSLPTSIQETEDEMDVYDDEIMIFGQSVDIKKDDEPKSKPARKGVLTIRISQLELDTAFWYDDNKYTHSAKNRSGGGKVAVVNMGTGEETYLLASAFCEVYLND